MERFFAYARVLASAAPVREPTVTVYLKGTLTLATLYADNGVTPKANPFTADENGFLFFYAANGAYDVRLSGGTPAIPTPYTWGDVILLDTFDNTGVGFTQQADVKLFAIAIATPTLTRTLQADMNVESGAAGVYTGAVFNCKTSVASTWDPSGGQMFGFATEAALRNPSTSEVSVLGCNIQAKLLEGATGFGEITGGEVDVVSEEEPTYRCGWLLSSVPSSENPTLQNLPASGAVDCALGIGAKNFGAKFRDGIFFHAFSTSQFPIQTSGSLIRAYSDDPVSIFAGLNLLDTNGVSYTYPVITPGFRIKFTPGATYQMSIGTNADPTAGAVLDLAANDGALLIPRLTTAQRDALPGPTNGMEIYNLDTDKFQGFAAGVWVDFH